LQTPFTIAMKLTVISYRYYNTVSLCKSYQFETRIYLRVRLHTRIVRADISGCSLRTKFIAGLPRIGRIGFSRVNCKVSGCREIWEPRAAAGIRAIHRMQICVGAFLGEAIIPMCIRGIQPLPL